jgi:hypothetical protein
LDFLFDHSIKFSFKRDIASLDLEEEAATQGCDFGSAAITLIEENAITENAMQKLKVLTAAVALLFVTPILAQEMGGATGPGSSRGLEPTYNNGYYSRYDQGGPVRVGGGALDGNNSYAMSRMMATAPSAIGPTIRHPERTRAMTDGAIPVDKLKSERSAQYADLEARSRAEMPVVQEGGIYVLSIYPVAMGPNPTCLALVAGALTMGAYLSLYFGKVVRNTQANKP